MYQDHSHLNKIDDSDHSTNAWYLKINLITALLIIILAALLIVALAYSLYWRSSDRKYDLARGGTQPENTALTIEDPESDRTSRVDSTATKQKLEYLEKEVKALSNIGNFNPEDLSDENLQLITPSQPSF